MSPFFLRLRLKGTSALKMNNCKSMIKKKKSNKKKKKQRTKQNNEETSFQGCQVCDECYSKEECPLWAECTQPVENEYAGEGIVRLRLVDDKKWKSSRKGEEEIDVPQVNDTNFMSGDCLYPYPEDFDPNHWKKLANYALDDFKTKEGVELEIVGNVIASLMAADCECFHLSFNVKDNDGYTKLMFVEIFLSRKHNTNHVSYCGFVSPPQSNSVDTSRMCRLYCPSTIIHPSGVKLCQYPSFG